jgi:hypothetical protein
MKTSMVDGPFCGFGEGNLFGTFLAIIKDKPVLEMMDHSNRVICRRAQERRIGNDKKIFIRFPRIFWAYFYHMVFRFSGKLSRGGCSTCHSMGRRR